MDNILSPQKHFSVRNTSHVSGRVLVAGFMLLAGLFFASPPVHAATYVSDDITEDTTWTADGSPYLIDSGFGIPAGVTLTVRQGTVVKMGGEHSFFVDGTLRVDGTVDEPVIFTSLFDDVGGDSYSGDGPDRGDWNSLRFGPSSVGDLRHAEFRFGGMVCFDYCYMTEIYNEGGDLWLDNVRFSAGTVYGLSQKAGSVTAVSSSFEGFSTGLALRGGTAAVSGSSFAGNSSGVMNSTGAPIDMRSNWWGDPSGPYHSVLNPSGVGSRVGDNVLFDPWLAADPLAPVVMSLAQHQADGSTAIPSGASTNGDVVLSAVVGSPTGKPVALQVEVKQVGQPFDWSGLVTSEFHMASGSATVTISDLDDGDYKWRARALDGDWFTSAWVEFGQSDVADFVVDQLPSGPSLFDLRQLDADGSDIAPSAETREAGLTLRASVSSPSGLPVKLQVQVRPMSEPLDEDTVTTESPAVSFEGEVSVPFRAYLDVPYHWQARVVDETGNRSPWIEFGSDPADADFVEFVRTFKVEVVMAEPSNVSHLNSPWTGQPCKLLPGKTYVEGHGREYFENLGYCVNDYYRENSFGKIAFEIHYHDNGGSWHKLQHDEATYGVDRLEPGLYSVLKGMVDEAVSAASAPNGDIVVLVHSGRSQQSAGEGKINTVALRKSTPQYVIVSEYDQTGQWAHELSHVVGVETTPLASMTPDLYVMGKNVKQWCLMANGDSNGDHGSDPAPVCSYTREFLGWMKTDGQSIIAADDYGEHLAEATATGDYGQAVTRINLADGTSVAAQDYYLVESRARFLGNWNSSMPTGLESALVLFRVKENGFIEYGYDASGVGYNLQRSVNLASNRRFGLAPLNDGVLDPSQQEQYIDYDQGLVIKALADETSAGHHGTRFALSSYDASQETQKLAGAVLLAALPSWAALAIQPFIGNQGVDLERLPAGQGSAECLSANPPGYLETYRIVALALLVAAAAVVLLALAMRKSWKGRRRSTVVIAALVVGLMATTLGLYTKAYVDGKGYGTVCRNPGAANGASADGQLLPDSDLHAACPDGRHVGVDYATGDYEVDIDDAITNGDNVGTPEWIFFPSSSENVGCRLYVSSHNSESFMAAHPEIAAQVTDPSERYSIYARVIDPVTGVLTSATLENQVIQPGQEVVHTVTSDASGAPVIEVGMVDDDAPITSVSIVGASGQGGWFTGPVAVTLSATDGEGTGAASTRYSANGGLTWETYVGPFTITDEGLHDVLYGSVDRAGNSEETKPIEIRIDSVPPETLIHSGPDATTADAAAIFAFTSAEAGASFSCSLDGAAAEPCVSPRSYSGLTFGTHSFYVYAVDQAGNADQTPATWAWTVRNPDADGDGVLDAADDCPAIAGAPERDGCPYADRTNVDMRIVDSAKTGACGYRPDGRPITECTRPLAGVTVKVFDRDDTDFRAAFGGRRPVKHIMDDVYESDIGLVAACVTGADGSCLAGEDHPGRFLVVMKYTEGTQSVYTGKFKEFRKSVRLAYDAEDDDDDVFMSVNPNYLTLTKNLHVIKHIKRNGEIKLDSGRLTVVTGSRLDILQPDYVVWSGGEDLYPFVLTADDNDWTVNACLEVPQGYEIAGVLDGDGNVASTTNCLNVVLRNESKVFLFRAVDIGSPEPDFGLTLKVSHPGKALTKVKTRLQGMRSRMEAGIEKGVRSRVKTLVPKWVGRSASIDAKSRASFGKKTVETKRQ